MEKINRLDAQQKQRLKKLIVSALVLSAILAAYLIITKIIGFGIPCVFYELTGLHCPGCGISRMLQCLLFFDFAGAAKNNLFILILIPFAIPYVIVKCIKFVKAGPVRDSTLETVVAVILLILFAIFAILRNLPAFDFLAPDDTPRIIDKIGALFK